VRSPPRKIDAPRRSRPWQRALVGTFAIVIVVGAIVFLWDWLGRNSEREHALALAAAQRFDEAELDTEDRQKARYHLSQALFQLKQDD
jgi:hypothetical protein